MSASLASISVTCLKASMAAGCVAGIFREQAEAVPRVGTLGILLECVFERLLRFVDLLQVQVGDAFVEPRDRKLRIGIERLLELFQSFFEELLIHVGDAKIVVAAQLRSGLGFDGLRVR